MPEDAPPAPFNIEVPETGKLYGNATKLNPYPVTGVGVTVGVGVFVGVSVGLKVIVGVTVGVGVSVIVGVGVGVVAGHITIVPITFPAI